MTAWLVCFHVFVLHGLARCNLTSSTTSAGNISPSRAFYLSAKARYQKLIDQSNDEALKLFYVSSPKHESISLRFKLATDQVYFLGFNNISQLCAKQMRNISEGIHRGDKWALAFLDSNGQQSIFDRMNQAKLPGSHEQCETIDVKGFDNDVISGKYIMMASFPPLVNNTPIELHITWYVCVPTSCTLDDYKSMATTFEDTYGFQDVAMHIIRLGDPPKDYWYYAAIVTLSTLAFICILATSIDCLYTYCLTQPSPEQKISLNQSEEDDIVGFVSKEDDVMKGKLYVHLLNLGHRMLQSFSLRQNLSDILKTSSSEGDIGCLHGLRVLSMMWVIFGHSGNSMHEPREQRQLERISKGNFVILAYSAPYAVDTFFLLSGCLVSYLFIKTVNKACHLKCTHMVMYYIHRYIRLTPLFIVVMIIYAGIMPYLVHGSYAQMFKYDCDRYWWRNLLYINNLFTLKQICVSWSWYLSDDMQFYVIAPLVTVPIVYGFHKIGLLMASLMLMCHIIASTYVLEVIRNSQTSEFFDYMSDLYIKPWTRIGPYAIGLVLGYFLSVRKTDLKINKLVLLLGWLTCTAVGLFLILSENYTNKFNADIVPDLSTLKLRVREIVKSPLWAICVTWVILACHFGYGGLLNNFLTWKAWIPLSKLTYGTYLCHKMIIQYFNLTLNDGSEINNFYFVERFLSVTVLTNFMSLILSLMIEIPTRNLLKTSQKSSVNVGHYKLEKEERTESKVKTFNE